jgi:hypothetical protein
MLKLFLKSYRKKLVMFVGFCVVLTGQMSTLFSRIVQYLFSCITQFLFGLVLIYAGFVYIQQQSSFQVAHLKYLKLHNKFNVSCQEQLSTV